MNNLYKQLNPMANMIEQFNQFKQNFKGDPKAQVQQMLSRNATPTCAHNSTWLTLPLRRAHRLLASSQTMRRRHRLLSSISIPLRFLRMRYRIRTVARRTLVAVADTV